MTEREEINIVWLKRDLRLEDTKQFLTLYTLTRK